MHDLLQSIYNLAFTVYVIELVSMSVLCAGVGAIATLEYLVWRDRRGHR